MIELKEGLSITAKASVRRWTGWSGGDSVVARKRAWVVGW